MEENKPVRILNLFTIMNRGGAETMVMNYYRNIDRTKLQFDFMVHRQERGAYDDEIEALGGKIYRMMPIRPGHFLEYRKQLHAFFSEHLEYKVIHAHMSELGCYAFMEAKRQGIPYRICNAHSYPRYFDLKMIIRYYFKARMMPYLTHLFVCGTEAGEWLYGKKNKNRFILMNNAVDVEKYRFSHDKQQQIKNRLRLQNTFVIGHVGSFFDVKNHTFLIDIFSEISKHRDDARLLLVGDGNERPNIEQKVRRLGLEGKVIFTGIRSDVNDLLQAMDVFVFPSKYEGLPVTLIEAQASGLPCLISDVIPSECKKTELIHTLSLTDPVSRWAEKAIELFEQTNRQDTADLIREQSYDIKQNAERMQEFYLSAYQ